MKKTRVLIVEDEPIIAADLEDLPVPIKAATPPKNAAGCYCCPGCQFKNCMN